MRPHLAFMMGLCVGLALLSESYAIKAPHNKIYGDDLEQLMAPMLATDPSHHIKLPREFIQRKALTIPAPALVVSFSSSGCVTFASGIADIARDDGKCFPGKDMPSLDDFLSAAKMQATGNTRMTMLVISPLFDPERLKLMFPDTANDVEIDLSSLEALVASLREQYPERDVITIAMIM